MVASFCLLVKGPVQTETAVIYFFGGGGGGFLGVGILCLLGVLGGGGVGLGGVGLDGGAGVGLSFAIILVRLRCNSILDS